MKKIATGMFFHKGKIMHYCPFCASPCDCDSYSDSNEFGCSCCDDNIVSDEDDDEWDDDDGYD